MHLGVQTTLYDMGMAVLSDEGSGLGQVAKSIRLNAPNLHNNIPFSFDRVMGGRLENADATGHPDVFIATTEPHGIIEIELSNRKLQ